MYQKTFMGPESAKTHILVIDIEDGYLVEYSHGEPPVFLGGITGCRVIRSNWQKILRV